MGRQQRGFKSGLLLTDPNTGKGVSVTLWETEADMIAGESSGYLQEQFAKVGAILVGPPVTEHYEVSIQSQAHANPVTTGRSTKGNSRR